MDNLFVFRRFFAAEQDETSCRAFQQAAVDKLQTLYPGQRILVLDENTIGVEDPESSSASGLILYDLGLVDEEIPAIMNRETEDTLTFRV